MLPLVNKILYAADLGEGSRPAFSAAINLCGRFKSEITYLHVIEPLTGSAKVIINSSAELYKTYEESLEGLHKKIEQRIEAYLKTEVDEIDLLKLSDINIRVEEGVTWKKILEVAIEIDADVIVMGTRKSSSVGQFFTGSTANKVMLNSKKPLLIIPLIKDKEKVKQKEKKKTK